MSGDLLGFAALAVLLAAGAVWMRLLRAVRIPRRRTPFLAAIGLAVALGLAAFATGTGLAGGLAAGAAVAAGAGFLGLQLQSAQQRDPLPVSVGGPVLDFTAPDADGALFESLSLRGRPYLLKFFRGHW